MVSIPRPLLTSRLPDAHRLTARHIGHPSKLGALAGSLIRRLALLEGQAQETVTRLGMSALDIFAATIEVELTGEALGHSRDRLAKVKKYILSTTRGSTSTR